MHTTFSVFIGASLDGFIARNDGSLDWLPGSTDPALDEDTGYHEFYASVDTLVMGRNTWETVRRFAVWPYQGKRVIVLSSRFGSVPEPLAHDAQGLCASPARLANELQSTGAQHVYVDGGRTIQNFLRAGLIDELTITVIPVLLGSGIPLFGDLEHDVRLLLLSTRGFKNGMVQSRYRVLRET
jgi:dihydrofolate reductase